MSPIKHLLTTFSKFSNMLLFLEILVHVVQLFTEMIIVEPEFYAWARVICSITVILLEKKEKEWKKKKRDYVKVHFSKAGKHDSHKSMRWAHVNDFIQPISEETKEVLILLQRAFEELFIRKLIKGCWYKIFRLVIKLSIVILGNKTTGSGLSVSLDKNYLHLNGMKTSRFTYKFTKSETFYQ